MKEDWRFRTNWRGQCILQRRHMVHSHDALRPYYEWHDATASDLLDYGRAHA